VTTVAVLVRRARCGARFGCFAFETVACTVDRKALFVQQIPDTPDQQHFVMLIVTAVAPPFDRLQLYELLLPIAKHVRLTAHRSLTSPIVK